MVPGYNIPSATGSNGGRSRETVDMIVPANKAGLIIGSHGDNLRRIENKRKSKCNSISNGRVARMSVESLLRDSLKISGGP